MDLLTASLCVGLAPLALSPPQSAPLGPVEGPAPASATAAPSPTPPAPASKRAARTNAERLTLRGAIVMGVGAGLLTTAGVGWIVAETGDIGPATVGYIAGVWLLIAGAPTLLAGGIVLGVGGWELRQERKARKVSLGPTHVGRDGARFGVTLEL